jgi:hypothetical protein
LVTDGGLLWGAAEQEETQTEGQVQAVGKSKDYRHGTNSILATKGESVYPVLTVALAIVTAEILPRFSKFVFIFHPLRVVWEVLSIDSGWSCAELMCTVPPWLYCPFIITYHF